MTPEEKKRRLDRMAEIVKTLRGGVRETSLISELIHLANDPGFTGMDGRRNRLAGCLERLKGVNQKSAVENWWEKIDDLIYDFPTEIELYRR